MSNTSKKFLLEKVSNNTNKNDNTLCFKLYKDGNYIKTYTPEKSNQLNEYIKSNNIEGKIFGKSIWYDNEEIMKLIISNNKTKNKKINKRNLIGLNTFNNSNNLKLNSNGIFTQKNNDNNGNLFSSPFAKDSQNKKKTINVKNYYSIDVNSKSKKDT
jgi:hypothetical protein